ncbi:MAG: glycosyltransferase [Patescibacteria group bacterium]
MSKAPKVSVLMSVYNSEEFLREAIDSILGQTYKDFEFIIINDGSTDDSLNIIKSYGDSRIRLISRDNKGLTASLNEGLELAKGEYIARQDSDDVSVPTRLQKEVDYLDANPKTGLVGSNYTVMDVDGKKLTTTNVFTAPADLKLTQITCNQYGHGSVMIRKSVLAETGDYDKGVGYVEDYDLWTRISRVADIANIEQPLYLYRRNDDGITRQNLDLQIQQTFAVRDKAFEHFLKHRRDYRALYYKPSGHHYRNRKAVLYRDMAYLHRKADRLFGGLAMILLAILLEPTNKKNYRYAQYVLYKPRFDRWEYEFL